MRRILLILLCIFLLGCLPARAEEERYVALTFDDGPSGRFTRRLLEGLEQRDVQATFLLCGYRLEIYPSLAKKIYASGHEIGLHGYSHRNMANMSAYELHQEIEKTRKLLPEGCRPSFLRPPGGSENQLVGQVARQEGLSILTWSVDPRDWAVHDALAVEAAVVSQVRDGDVILLHDLSDSSVDAALAIIDRLQKDGFRFVTVSQLALLRGVQPQPGKTYLCFPPE